MPEGIVGALLVFVSLWLAVALIFRRLNHPGERRREQHIRSDSTAVAKSVARARKKSIVAARKRARAVAAAPPPAADRAFDHRGDDAPPELSDSSKLEMLASSDPQRRGRAAFAITMQSCVGDDAEDDPGGALRLFLENEWSAIALEKREGLVKPLVTTLLEDESLLVIEIAASALATQGEDGITALLEHIDHPDFCVRSKVAIGTGLLNKAGRWAVPRLLRAASTERVPLVRGDLVRAINRIENADAPLS